MRRGYCKRCKGRKQCKNPCKRVRQIITRKSKKKQIEIVLECQMERNQHMLYSNVVYGAVDEE